MFRIRLAGITVEIDNRHNLVFEQCKDYLCDDCAPAFRVAVSTAETQSYQASCGRPMTLPEAESYLLYRRICERMPKYGVFLLHAAVVEMEGRGYAFSARRGTGKSTHTELWQSHFKGRATVINGDKPLIRRAPDGRFWAYGTPWCGKEGWHKNTSAKLKAICFLERGEENSIEPISPSDSSGRMLRQILMPSEPQGAIKTLELVDRMLKDVPLWLLKCNISEESAILAFNTMSK
jgi:hypothetical protein